MFSTAATEDRTTTAIKIPLLCFVYLGFVSSNGGHNYFKFQSYGTVTHDKYAQALNNLVVVLV